MEKAASLASTISDYAAFALIAGFVLCLAAPLRGTDRRAQADATAATSRATAASSL